MTIMMVGSIIMMENHPIKGIHFPRPWWWEEGYTPPSSYLKNNQGSLTHQHPLVATNESWDSSNRWPASWDLNQVLVTRSFTWWSYGYQHKLAEVVGNITSTIRTIRTKSPTSGRQCGQFQRWKFGRWKKKTPSPPPKKKKSHGTRKNLALQKRRFHGKHRLWVHPRLTLPETNSEWKPLKIGRAPKGDFIFQPSIFRCELLVSGRVKIYKISSCYFSASTCPSILSGFLVVHAPFEANWAVIKTRAGKDI